MASRCIGRRILLTAPCLALLLLGFGRLSEVRAILARLPAEPRLWLGLPLPRRWLACSCGC
ncbi:hypothetical protein SSTU70S_05401 [Stutzerimonas stutzeri]